MRKAVLVFPILLIVFGSAFILEGIFLKTTISREYVIGVGVLQLVVGTAFAYLLYRRKSLSTIV